MAWALDSNGALRGGPMCEPGACVRRWWLALMRALIEDASPWQSGCGWKVQRTEIVYVWKPQVYIVTQVYMYWCICTEMGEKSERGI